MGMKWMDTEHVPAAEGSPGREAGIHLGDN